MRKKPPNNYREMPEVIAAYEEGGRAIGRAIMWDLSREEYFWNLLKGLDLWPRWYLTAFKGIYMHSHPKEKKSAAMQRYRRKLAKQKRRAKLESIQRQANDSELFQDGG